MVQRRGGVGLLLESMEAVGVGGKRGGQHLDRHVATQARVTCAVDVAHAARANDPDDFIGAEPLAGEEGHGATLILRVAPGPAKGKGRCVQFAIKPFSQRLPANQRAPDREERLVDVGPLVIPHP